MRSLLTGAILALLLVLSGCTADTRTHLTFATHLSVNDGDETIVVGEVRNAGFAPLRSLGILGGVLRVQDESGRLMACASVPELTAAIDPGDSDFPLRWRGRLEPGRYALLWGAPAHGGIRANFAVVEGDKGLFVQRSSTTRLESTAGLSSCDAAGAVPTPGAQ